jgi:tetratricopeptide (TPR) repeat protein
MASTLVAPAAAAARPTRVGRVLGMARNWKVALGLGGVTTVALIGVWLGLTLLAGEATNEERQFLVPRALARLDAGELAEARRLATELRQLPDATLAERGAALYVLGSILAREAQEQQDAAKQRVLYLVAARYLEDAQTHGFPPGREADAVLTLGRALHHSGRHAQALASLRESLDQSPHAAAELHRLLALSYAALTPPKHKAALEHARAYLAVPDLAPTERHAGALLVARLQLAGGNTTAASQSLAQVPDDSPLVAEAVMLRAQVAIESARSELKSAPQLTEATQQSLAKMIDALRDLESRTGIDRDVIPHAQLLAAQCYEASGDRRAAAAQFDRLRRGRFGRPDGLAAAFFLAEIHRQEGRPAAAVEMYKQALMQAGPRDAYDNSWLPLATLESRLTAAAADLTAGGHYAESIELTKAMLPLVSEGLALRQRIAAREAWGGQLLAQSRTQPALLAETTRAEARQHFREAGAGGERLAELSIASRNYVADLAAAAENYQRGQGYRQAARVWRVFLRQNPRERRPEAMVGLGESLLALGAIDAALTALQNCRDEFPTHPATYRARLLESRAWQEKGDLTRAKDLLLDNLYRHALTPKSSEWRDSLFALGHLLYRQASEEETQSRMAGVDLTDTEAMKEGLKLLEQSYATYQEAIRVLTEAVQRYPTASQALLSRYWIAEAYRHSALAPRRKLAVTNIETSRLALNRQITQELDAALDEYQKLVAELSDEQSLARRTPVELALLRNCYFGRADALFDLRRYDEAIQAYSAATNRYQNEPESLEAYVQIAACYRRLARPNEARGTLEQARVVLQRIRSDADFHRTTRLGRQQWDELLGWLRTL